MRTNADLLEDVAGRALGYLGGRPRSGRVLDALGRVDRALFLPEASREEAYEDAPLPIGHGQTCSEPSMVAFMLDLLETAPGQRMLEVGAGSGYAAAAASLLCAPGGAVYACEAVPALAAALPSRLERWKRSRRYAGDDGPFADVQVIPDDGSGGFPSLAPFDRILLSAGVRTGKGRFDEGLLLRQLSPDGVLVYPETFGDLYRLRRAGDSFTRETWTGVSFVPLVGRYS